MNESQFIQSIHKKINKDVYCWKISDRFTAGIADAYYSGHKNDLWVEYKFCRTLPKIIIPKLTALQVKWLGDRYKEKRNVAVVYGTPRYCMVYRNLAWLTPLDRETFIINSFNRTDVADWIISTIT